MIKVDPYQRFEPLNTQYTINNEDSSDPDEMYTQWVRPFLKNEKTYSKKEWQRDIDSIFKIQNHPKESPHPFSPSLVHELSIQVSLYDALFLLHTFSYPSTTTWQLQMNPDQTFAFGNQDFNHQIQLIGNTIQINKNNTPYGTLSIDMEQRLLEKIHGKINQKPFILDPIWFKKQKKVTKAQQQVKNEN